MKNMFVAAALCTAMLTMGASSASATPFSFAVVVNTAPLMSLAATQGLFSLDFQLNGTGANTVTIDTFDFGGGTFVGAPTIVGGAGGSLASAVTLSDAASFSNELFQQFTPGGFLSFMVTMTTNVVAPAPDAFSFAILDGNTFNIPTTGLGSSLVMVDIANGSLQLSDVQAAQGMDQYAGVGVGVTAAPVPEPASLLLFGSGLIGVATWARRRARGAR